MQKFFEELRAAAAAYNMTIPSGIIIKRERKNGKSLYGLLLFHNG